MVGGVGWGARTHRAPPVTTSDDISKPNGKSTAKDKAFKTDGSAAMDIAEENENGNEPDEENISGQVLDEIMPRRATRAKGKGKRRLDADEDKETTPEPRSKRSGTENGDVEMAEEGADSSSKPTDEPTADKPNLLMEVAPDAAAAKVDPATNVDATGEVDAEGEADAEGEVDAQGEDDGESADVVDGVIGLSGESNIYVGMRLRRRYRRC